MKTCRYCEEVIGDKEQICPACGYNPQTDTLTPGFVRKSPKAASLAVQKKVGPGVKRFAFWGVLIIAASLGFQYQRQLADLFLDSKEKFLGKTRGKGAKAAQAVDLSKPASRLQEVRSVKVASGKTDKIEGIFYDPNGKSWVVIGGRLVSENQGFADMLVKKINRDSVVVIQDGQERTLVVK